MLELMNRKVPSFRIFIFSIWAFKESLIFPLEKGGGRTVLTTVVFWGLNRYEDEINKRTSAENDFVTIKKVSERLPWARGE